MSMKPLHHDPVRVLRDARHDASIPPLARCLLQDVYELQDDSGWCYANDKHFAEAYGASIRTVQWWLQKLDEHGYLERDGAGKARRLRVRTTQSTFVVDSATTQPNGVVHNSTTQADCIVPDSTTQPDCMVDEKTTQPGCTVGSTTQSDDTPTTQSDCADIIDNNKLSPEGERARARAHARARTREGSASEGRGQEAGSPPSMDPSPEMDSAPAPDDHPSYTGPVEVYEGETGHACHWHFRKLIEKDVPLDRLDDWIEVCVIWTTSGYNTRNVRGMLEHFHEMAAPRRSYQGDGSNAPVYDLNLIPDYPV